MGGFGRETQVSPSPVSPLMPTHPSPPFLFSHEGGTVLGVKALDDSYSERGDVWHCVGEKWGSVFGFFFSFLLKKRENSKKSRSASAWPDGTDGLVPICTHTHA